MIDLTFTDEKQELGMHATFAAEAKEFAIEVAKALEASVAIKNVKLVASTKETIYPPKEEK